MRLRVAFFFFGLLLHLSIGKVIQTFTIFRHGARTPSHFNFEPGQYTQKPGDLTDLGKQQTRELGERLRRKYIEGEKLISPEYDNKHQVFVKSSVLLRTNESTAHVLKGLFPNKNLNDITVNYACTVRDLYYHAHKEVNCPFIAPALENVKRSDEYLSMESYFRRNLYPTMVQKINEGGRHNYTVDMLNMVQAKRIFDGYKCNSVHGKKNPNYSKEEVEMLYKLNLWLLYRYNFGPEIVQKLTNSPVFEDIYNFMDCITDANKHMHDMCPRMALFSAHDFNLVPILKSLVPLNKLLNDKQYVPPFASDITIEVHQDHLNEEPWVQVLYNGKVLPLWEGNLKRVSRTEFRRFLKMNIVPNVAATCTGEAAEVDPRSIFLN